MNEKEIEPGNDLQGMVKCGQCGSYVYSPEDCPCLEEIWLEMMEEHEEDTKEEPDGVIRGELTRNAINKLKFKDQLLDDEFIADNEENKREEI
jgi:hypothetical protein